jgi:2-C-methyl-D-erythritol 4-phosphate cytidylyltransferase
MIVVLIPAAGSGSRIGGDTPKQFLPIGGVPILARTMLAFERAPRVDRIIVACPEGDAETVRTLATDHGVSKLHDVVPGGKTRQDSVWNALQAAPEDAEIVLVHDAVRPFVSVDEIDRVIDAARAFGGAALASRATDTIKQVDDEGFVENTLDRELLWRAQTPQGFKRELLVRALKKAHHDKFIATDESSAAEWAGIEVKIVEGSAENVKITTPVDLLLAEVIALKGPGSQGPGS